MSEKLFDVNFSYTLDYITWTCPQCGHFVEKCGLELDDLECEMCGYIRPECSLDGQDTTSETETLGYEEPEEED